MSDLRDALWAPLVDLKYVVRSNLQLPRPAVLPDHHTLQSVDVVAFAGTPGLDSACIVGHQLNGIGPSPYLGAIEQLTAPYVYLAKASGEGEIWKLGPGSEPRVYQRDRIATVHRDRIADYLREQAEVFAPTKALETKFRSLPTEARGLSDLNAHQLSFASLGLFDYQEGQTEGQLVTLLNDCVRQAKKIWEEFASPLPEDADVRLGRALLRLIAACALADKGVIQADRKDLKDTIVAARRQLPSFMDYEQAPSLPVRVLETLWLLLAPVRFELLTGDMLAGMYQRGLVREVFKRKQGVYYTPASVRRYMWDAVTPTLMAAAPAERRILDPTCGSGAFLTTAYEGLRWQEQQDPLAHEVDLNRQRLFGVDLDPFAVDLCRLDLILQSRPTVNNWRIHNGAFQDWQPNPAESPLVIIGNPPFGGHEQLARKALEKSLDWVRAGGTIALVMPKSFLSGAESAKARQRLVRECRIERILELPAGTFAAQVLTCIIIAHRRKNPTNSYSLKYGSLDPAVLSAEQVRKLNVGDLSFVRWTEMTPDQFLAGDFELPEVWAEVRESQNAAPAGAVIQFRQGIKPKYTVIDAEPDVRKTPEGGYQPYLENAERHVRPFWLARPAYLKWPPEGMYYTAKDSMWLPGKVMMGRHLTDKARWRLFGGVDREGVIYNSRVLGAFPLSSEWPADALLAFLSSSFANAWFSCHSRQMDLTAAVLDQMMVPFIDPPRAAHLSSLAQALEVCSRSAAGPLFQAAVSRAYVIRTLLREIDLQVYDALNLSSESRRFICEYLSRGGERRPGMPDPTYDDKAPEVSVTDVGVAEHRTGVLLTVDLELQACVIAWQSATTIQIDVVANRSFEPDLLQAGRRLEAMVPVRTEDEFRQIQFVTGAREEPAARASREFGAKVARYQHLVDLKYLNRLDTSEVRELQELQSELEQTTPA